MFTFLISAFLPSMTQAACNWSAGGTGQHCASNTSGLVTDLCYYGIPKAGTETLGVNRLVCLQYEAESNNLCGGTAPHFMVEKEYNLVCSSPVNCHFSGTYSWGSCSVPFNGTLNHGVTQTYTNTAIGYTGSTQWKCTDGVLSNISQTCTANACQSSVPTNASAWDGEESSGLTNNTTSWSHNTSDTTNKCEYTCNTGYTWNGSSCVAPANCPLPWGGSVASGGSVTAYQSPSVTSPSTCTSQTRTCTAGTLSGTYTNQSCSVTNTTVNGSCSATAETCAAGTYSNAPADTGTHYQWTCLGGGSPIGTNSGTCSAVIPTYTYTFNSNGGTPSYTSVTGVAGSSVSSPGSPTRTGYTFTGWSPAIPSTMPVNGGGSTAQWSANPSASISANNCTISENASTCNSSVSWSSSFVSSPQVRQDGSAFSLLASGSASRSVSNGNTTFTFSDGGSELASSVAVGSCIGGTSWNGSMCVTNTPSTPANLNATANTSCGVGEVSLSWSASPTATLYVVERNGIIVYSGAATSFSDTDRPVSTSHTYAVRASNAGGDSAYSLPVSVTTAPPCPTGSISADSLTVVYNQTRTISWTSSNTSACTVSRTDGGADWSGTSSGGEVTEPLTTNATYVLICDGTNMDSVTISVLAIPTLTVDTRIVRPGTPVNLVYNTNGQSCTLTGGTLPPTPLNGDSVYPVTVQARTVYTLTCPGGTVRATTEVVPRTFET